MAKKLTDVEKYSTGGAGDLAGVIPTRSPVLNYFLGGGLPLNSVITFFGEPGCYKTTSLIEAIAQTQAHGGLVMIASNEDSVKRTRITHFGGKGDEVPILEHQPPDNILTVECIQRKFYEYFADKRLEDFEAVVATLKSGKMKAAYMDHYVHKLGIAKKYARDGEYIAGKMKPQKGDKLNYSHLHPEHKRIILFGIDSGTACPSDEGFSRSLAGKKGLMTEASAWSLFYKNHSFIDNRAMLIIVNQTRLKMNDSFNTWRGEACASATAFHAHVQIEFSVFGSGVLRQDPLTKAVSPSGKDNYSNPPVGAVVGVKIHKNKRTGIDQIKFPQVMWKYSGTDTPWTMFQLLLEHGVITKTQGRYCLLVPDGKELKKLVFYLKDFHSKIYGDPALYQIIFDHVSMLLARMAARPYDTLKYAETHAMAYQGHVDSTPLPDTGGGR